MNETGTYLTIGAFSRASRLSRGALGLYDELGLLPPARVDAATGYRFYTPGQLKTARLIGLLRQLDLPLNEVCEVLDAPASRRGSSANTGGDAGWHSTSPGNCKERQT